MSQGGAAWRVDKESSDGQHGTDDTITERIRYQRYSETVKPVDHNGRNWCGVTVGLIVVRVHCGAGRHFMGLDSAFTPGQPAGSGGMRHGRMVWRVDKEGGDGQQSADDTTDVRVCDQHD